MKKSLIWIFTFAFMINNYANDELSDHIKLTAQTIQKMNVRNIIDLLNQLPGITAGSTSVKLQGSYDVKVLLDGRPINDPLSSHSAIKWDQVSFNDIKEIEIFKGSGAAKFGDGTSGGAISITLKNIDQTSKQIEMQAGNFKTRQITCDCNYKKGKYGIGTNIDYYEYGGFRVNNDKTTHKIGLKTSYEMNKKKDVTFSVDYSDLDQGYAGFPAYPTPNSRNEAKALGGLALLNFNDIKSSTYVNKFNKHSQNPDRNLDSKMESTVIGENIAFSFKKINTAINFEVSDNEGSHISSLKEHKAGLAMNKNIKPFGSQSLSFDTGFRINVYSEFSDVFNPEFSIIYKHDKYNCKLSANKTNNTPTFRKRYYETSSLIPNPHLGMERAANISFNFSCQLLDDLEADLSIYYNKIKDRITYVRQEEGFGQYQNFGKVTRKGAELFIKWKIHEKLKVKPSYTHLVALDEETGHWLSATPRHEIKFDLMYKPFESLDIHYIYNYWSKKFTRSDNSEFIPGTSVSKLSVDYYLKDHKIYTTIENLVDKTYTYGDGLPAPGLKYRLGLKFKY